MRTPCLALLLATAPLAALPPGDFPLGGASYQPEKLEVNNRILIKVNGKPISVMDVVRKMDLWFFQRYPTLVDQTAARYQFYKENWRQFLQMVIDDKLVVADAEEKQIKVTDGEVRERLEETLGPDVVFTIESLGLTFDEAWDVVKTEMIVQKMTGMMVHFKAMSDVHPKMVKERYEKKLLEHPPQSSWQYRVISFKTEEAQQVADHAYTLLTEQKIPMSMLKEKFSGVAVNVSDSYERSLKDISQAHKNVLEKIKEGMFSQPVIKQGMAYIFYLEKFQEGKAPPFAEVAPEIKKELLQEMIVRYDQEYRERLRKRYGLTESFLSQLVPEKMHPFALR